MSSSDEEDVSQDIRSNGLNKGELQVRYLPGEKSYFIHPDVTYHNPFDGNIIGSLEVTNYKLVFSQWSQLDARYSTSHSESGSTNPTLTMVEIPLGVIQEPRRTTQNHQYGLQIFCKDFRDLKFSWKVPESQMAGRRSLLDVLKRLTSPLAHGERLFAFIYGECCLSARVFQSDGWGVYNPEEEYQRQNIFTNGWQITKVNLDYRLSDTYPALLAIPRDVPDDLLITAAPHRSKGRIPVLSWLHPESKASLTRCSQPLAGDKGRRNGADEELVRKIREANANANFLIIFDARPQVNAMANKEKGGGVEQPAHYENTQYVFVNIQNINTMRASQTRLQEACYPRPDDANWFKQLDNCQWLHHLRHILFAAASIADKIENNKTSVMVHCSDGWDRTAQVVSLAMVMLDPYYRTVRGFQVLIEKEWCSFGHRFAQRTGGQTETPTGSSVDDRAPIFLQFVDCIWQMTQQFRHAFEFNDNFLITILDELYTCRFGTFLYNSEMQRRDNHVREKTVSLWAFMNGLDPRRYLNPLYTPAEISGHRVILPQFTLSQLHLWNTYYIRWNVTMRCQQPLTKHDKFLVDVMANFRRLRAQRNEMAVRATPSAPTPVLSPPAKPPKPVLPPAKG